MLLVRSLALLAVAACAEPPTPFFTKGGPLIENDSVVYFGAATAEFGTNTVALPLHITANGMDVLHPGNGCAPGLVGVSLAPAVEIDATTDAPSRVPLVPEWRGRSVVRVRAEINVPFQCGTASSQFIGTSTYMFFSNDRVVRIDEGIRPSSAALDDDACACAGAAPADPYRLTTFWSFRNGTVYDSQLVPGPVTNKAACIDLGDVMIAVRYEDTDSSISAAKGNPIAEQQLLPPSSAGWDAGQAGSRSVSHVAFSVNSNKAMACDEAMAKITYPTVFVENEAVLPVEGIYRATAKRYASPVHVRVPQNVTSNFVLELDMGQVDHLKISLPDRVIDTYVVQQLGDHLLLDLPALAPDTPLTIEAI
ncbi:MAG TPA: hypothetical protein VL326_19570 [Kofleriaceae bacterium]|nr:hypothetical protein [Kofleriaceae bacterium]